MKTATVVEPGQRYRFFTDDHDNVVLRRETFIEAESEGTLRHATSLGWWLEDLETGDQHVVDRDFADDWCWFFGDTKEETDGR